MRGPLRFSRRAAALDHLLDELHEVSCTCSHTDHLLDVFRDEYGHVTEMRLGPCCSPGCRCVGGREADPRTMRLNGVA